MGLDVVGGEVTFRRLGGAGIRRNLRGSPGGALSLEAQILAQFAAAGWDVPYLFLAREADVTLVGSKVSVWANHGTAGDATQATDAARPTWDATGLNSKPTLDFSLIVNDYLSEAGVDMSSYTALSMTLVMQDAAASVMNPLTLGDAASGDLMSVELNKLSAGTIGGIGYGGVTRVQSAASYPMTTPKDISLTWDMSLTSHETEIRHGGVNVSSSWPLDSNTTGLSTTMPLVIGTYYTPTHGLTGQISAVVIGAGATAIPTTQIGAVESLLRTEWGV